MQEVLELLKGLQFGEVSFFGLVVLAIVSIFRGDIVPKSTLETLRTNWEAALKAKNEEIAMLRQAYTISEQARSTKDEAQIELLELSRAQVYLLESIQEKAKEVAS